MSDLHSLLSQNTWPITDDAIRLVFESMLADGSWGRYHGPHCDRLRSALCEFHNIEHTILSSSGTCAVELALRSVPVGPGDEIVLAAYDFKANFVNVLAVGAVPVLVDVLPGLPVMDVDQLAAACTNRTKAILVSHLHGCVAPIQDICKFAAERGIAVIEDACQNPGAMIDGRRAGTTGNIGVLSFGGSKLLTSGRGGALLTSDALMAQRIKLHTQRGNEAYPLSEMQAAVLLPQLNQLDARNQVRHERVLQLCETVPSTSHLRPVLSAAPQETVPAFYKMAFLISDASHSECRTSLCSEARLAGIPLDSAFQALHLIHSHRRFRAVGELTHARHLHDRLIILHHTALLQSDVHVHDMIQRLVDVVHRTCH